MEMLPFCDGIYIVLKWEGFKKIKLACLYCLKGRAMFGNNGPKLLLDFDWHKDSKPI